MTSVSISKSALPPYINNQHDDSRAVQHSRFIRTRPASDYGAAHPIHRRASLFVCQILAACALRSTRIFNHNYRANHTDSAREPNHRQQLKQQLRAEARRSASSVVGISDRDAVFITVNIMLSSRAASSPSCISRTAAMPSGVAALPIPSRFALIHATAASIP